MSLSVDLKNKPTFFIHMFKASSISNYGKECQNKFCRQVTTTAACRRFPSFLLTKK
jgi:hypothetical protein